MTTYNTYQEAKIANPESNIYIHTGEFWCEKSIRPSSWTYESRGFKLCNPADYCMTVEKFLADGYKFVEGDVVSNLDGGVSTVNYSSRVKSNDDYCLECMNYPEDGDEKRYILRAAALEEKKPHTKVEYVKSDIESRGRALDAFDGEVELFELVDGEYKQVTNESDAISKWRNLYERIETPMTEREAFIDGLSDWAEDGGLNVSAEVWDSLFDSGLVKLVN